MQMPFESNHQTYLHHADIDASPLQGGHSINVTGHNRMFNFFGGQQSRKNPTMLSASRPPLITGQHKSQSAFRKISETLSALNTVGRLLVNMTRGQSIELSNDSQKTNVSEAILTLSKNVLGQGATKTIEPLIKRVAVVSTTAAPEFLVVKNTSFTNNEISIEAKEGENRCTTPAGQLGRCEDLSNCPGLLLDLTHLRESLCFKSLFIPGVCCPLNDILDSTQKPLQLTTAKPIKTTTRQTLILQTTTNRPVIVPVRPQIGDNFVDPQECGQQEYSSGRIVGGVTSESGQWPWMAAIFLHGAKRTEFWCGGSLIGDKYVLTAAHCTRDSRQKPFAPNQFTVRLGDIDLINENEESAPVSVKVVEIRAHPRFSRVGFYNDIAVLVLAERVKKNKFVIPICLPSANLKRFRLPGKRATVVGWGTTYYGGKESSIQRQALLPIWKNEDCNKAYFQPITDNFLCAGYSEGGVDACQGDSGGGLFIKIESRWTQIGIVSFGNKCGEPQYPGVYTRVSQYTDWLQENTRN